MGGLMAAWGPVMPQRALTMGARGYNLGARRLPVGGGGCLRAIHATGPVVKDARRASED